MLRRTIVRGGQRVEFVVESHAPVSVVGAFNDWDPDRGALTQGADGTFMWATVLSTGRYAFRYLRDGEFFDDPDADAYETNGYGQHHGVLIVEAPTGDGTGGEVEAHASTPTPPTATQPKAPAKPRVKVDKAAGSTAPRKPRAPRTPSPGRTPSTEPTSGIRRPTAS